MSNGFQRGLKLNGVKMCVKFWFLPPYDEMAYQISLTSKL